MRRVVYDPQDMLKTLFWPADNLRDVQGFTIRRYSQITPIKPKYLFKNETSSGVTTLPSDIPADLEDAEYVQAMIYYFSGRTRNPITSQVFPLVLMLTTLPKIGIYLTSLNTGVMEWRPWVKVSLTTVT